MGRVACSESGPALPNELVLPKGKLVRTTPGGADALRKVFVDLKRYSFTGYVETALPGERAAPRGYVLVIEGNPEIALHAVAEKVTEGKAALRAIMEDSYSERCAIEIHAKVDAEAIRAAYPKAILERILPRAGPLRYLEHFEKDGEEDDPGAVSERKIPQGPSRPRRSS